MIGPSVQQQIDPLHTEMAELERLIGMQDELTIAGLCKGIDTTESEDKSQSSTRRPRRNEGAQP